jgi:hypothetical protein
VGPMSASTDRKSPAASLGLDRDADVHDHHESFLALDGGRRAGAARPSVHR